MFEKFEPNSESVDTVKTQELATESEEKPELEYEPFDPEKELERIKQLNPEDKEQGLEEFKRQYRWQQFVLTNLYDDIASELSVEPDTSKEKILERIDTAAKDGRFTEEQIVATQNAVDGYYERRANIRNLQEQHQSPEALYEHITNHKPYGRVEVKIDGVTIYFRCFDKRDYARIYNKKFSKEGISQEDVVRADKSGGVSVGGGPEDLPDAITAEKAYNKNEVSRRIFNHEREHAIQKLLKEQVGFNSFTSNSEHVTFSDASTIEELRDKTRRYIRERELAEREELMKDEIIAYLKGSEEDSETIIAELTKPPEQEGLYWPHQEDIEDLKSLLIENIYWAAGLEGEKVNKTIRNQVEKALEDFQDDIAEGVNAFEKMRDYGYSDRQISIILMGKPLDQWPKTADRMT